MPEEKMDLDLARSMTANSPSHIMSIMLQVIVFLMILFMI